MYSDNLVPGVIAALRVVAQRLDAAPPHVALDLLARLVLLSSNFLGQFMAADGLTSLRDLDALSPQRAPLRVVVNGLLIVSQAARVSEKYYPHIHRSPLVPTAIDFSHPGAWNLELECFLLRTRSLILSFSPLLSRANLYADIWEALGHSDGAVRSKAANLIGNLCRYSGYF